MKARQPTVENNTEKHGFDGGSNAQRKGDPDVTKRFDKHRSQQDIYNHCHNANRHRGSGIPQGKRQAHLHLENSVSRQPHGVCCQG